MDILLHIFEKRVNEDTFYLNKLKEIRDKEIDNKFYFLTIKSMIKLLENRLKGLI